VLDAWEHSYMLDYGLKRAEYIETFFKNIDWAVVSPKNESGKED
jgi:Fe-Mn family superoxide dismutase